jgi:hypothetical protein
MPFTTGDQYVQLQVDGVQVKLQSKNNYEVRCQDPPLEDPIAQTSQKLFSIKKIIKNAQKHVDEVSNPIIKKLKNNCWTICFLVKRLILCNYSLQCRPQWYSPERNNNSNVST